MKQARRPTAPEAFITLLAVIATILLGIGLQPGVEGLFLPLTLSIGWVAVLGFYLGHRFDALQEGMFKGLGRIVVAGLILLLIGMVISLWILGGTIPTLVFYGLHIITPSLFLPSAFLLCAFMSLSVGTSMGTIATAGVVLMGIQTGLNFSAPLTAGAIISGALFGDKMSPLSDSTNIAAAMGEADLFRHIRSMMYTTVPAALLALLLYSVVGTRLDPAAEVGLGEMLASLEKGWHIHLVHLVPVLLMLVLALKRVPALILLFVNVIVSGIWALVFQGASLARVFVTATSGFESQTGYPAVDQVMSRGGMTSMEPIVLLLLIAGALAGLMQSTGLLEAVATRLLLGMRSTGNLIVAVLVSSYTTLVLTGNQPLTLILNGQVFLDAFKQRKIDTTVLTRTLEDAGTIAAPLVPWGVMAAFSSQTLGVPTLEYLPYTWLPFLVPIFSVVFGYTGFAVWAEKQEEASQVQPH